MHIIKDDVSGVLMSRIPYMNAGLLATLCFFFFYERLLNSTIREKKCIFKYVNWTDGQINVLL